MAISASLAVLITAPLSWTQTTVLWIPPWV